MPLGDNKKSPSSKMRENQGLRLSIAFAAVALCWGWSLNLATGRTFAGLHVIVQQMQASAPFYVGYSVCLLCLGWSAKLFWDNRFRKRTEPRVNTTRAVPEHKKPWIAAQEAKAIATAFVAGTVLGWGVGYMSGYIAPANARAIFLASGAAFWVVLVGAFFSMLRRRGRDGNWRKIAPVLIAPPFISLASTAILNDPTAAGRQSPLYWGLRIALGAAILLIPVSVLLGLLPVTLVRQGKFNLAIRLNRLFFWAVGNNRSTEGWILVMAGRYAEARTYLKRLAFDKNGDPRLTSQEFFLYALSLSIENEEAQAEELFEAAVRVPQLTGDFHFGLADCLLTQHKQPERAQQLVESVLSGFSAHPSSIQQRANRAQMLAFYAWSLAANGARDAAEARIKEAMVASMGIRRCDLAALQLPVGDTWLALGETDKARASFVEAVTLFPYGDIAMRAQKKLSALDIKLERVA
jgi:tetratricopeptide (TPR) repeat protein